MTCSINIVRKANPKCECKHVPVEIERAIIQRDAEKELLKELEQEVNVERCLLDLYEKVGILKQRIEKLEGR